MNRSRRGLAVLILGIAFAVGGTGSASADPLWQTSVPFTNEVVSKPVVGGGYPVPPGQTAPDPGTCRPGLYNSNFSESWIAVEPGTENLVGTSKYFFETFSTFYDFHLGSFTIEGGSGVDAANQVQGYDCTTTGTQAMPPSWTNNTDPNVDFDTKGRAYQVTLPFNAFWANLHPNSNIAISYSDDRGRTWVKGNGGRPLEHAPNWSSKSLGFVEDKQWVAVNHIPGNRFQDHVYAAWAIYNGSTTKIRVAVSRDRGQSFSKATTITAPNQTGPVNEYVYPAVDAAGNVYVSIASDRPTGNDDKTIYVARSADDGVTWSRFMPVAGASTLPGCCLPNTTFRNGILEHFAASPDHPGHLYVVWEDWDGSQFDVKFSQSTNFGRDWSDADHRQRQRRCTGGADRSVPAPGGGRAGRGGGDQLLRSPRRLPGRARAFSPRTSGRRTSASMCPCRRSRTTVGARCQWAAMSASRSSPGTPSSRDRRSAGSTRWRARRTKTRAPPAPSSATTSGSRSPRQTSTRLRCRPTIRLP